MPLIRCLALGFGSVIILILAAALYDEAPDAEMLKRWEDRPRVADQDNLFLALVGADSEADEPAHVIGRRVLGGPIEAGAARLRVAQGNRELIDGVRAQCRAIPTGRTVPCLNLRLPEKGVGATETRMARRYLDLHRYTAYRSELASGDMLPVAGALLDPQAVFLATYLAVERGAAVPAEQLLTDIRFLRNALVASESIVARVVTAVALERDYRLLAEAIETGDAKQVATLRQALEPLPAPALDFSRDIPYEYAATRSYLAAYRATLGRGDDPLQEVAKFIDRPSPFPAAGWRRQLHAMWLKPEMSANAALAGARAQFGLPQGRSHGMIQRSMDALLNATGGEIQRFGDLGLGAEWKSYRERLSDLDYYVRLVSLVGVLAGQESFDPVRVMADWNAKLPGDAQGYRLGWDDKRSAFSFDPRSDSWQQKAKAAGHGVLVRVPRYLAPEVDAWNGISARCIGGRCDLLADGRKPIAAKPKAKLPDEAHLYPVVGEVKAGKYVGIEYLEQEESGEWVMRQVRIRAANAN